MATYEKKYKLKLEKPVQVEVYPDHEDFAVRTLGMPGLGALGVTFGYSVAMDSPSGRKPGTFHWASTLWHEMSHVYTLTATGHRVPRWFTEGMAVHEETAISPDWGDRLSPDVISAIKNKKLLPIAELDRGFVHPTAPAQVIVSYFQAGRICDYINEKWGWDTLLAMLHDFGAGEETAAVVRKELKIEPDEFDKRFLAYVEADTKNAVDHFDEWKKSLKSMFEKSKTKDWGAVIKEGTAIRDMYPDYVEEHSVYEALAEAYLATGDKTGGDRGIVALREDRRARSGIVEAAVEDAGRGGPHRGGRRRVEPAEFHLSDGCRRASQPGRPVAGAGQRQGRDPRICRRTGDAIRRIRHRRISIWPARITRTNRTSRRRKNCWPPWKRLRGSAPRRSSC